MSKKAQIRYNLLSGQSVIFAPDREKRPNDTKKDKSTDCPFCFSSVPKSKIVDQIPTSGKWQAASIKNVFPVMSAENKQAYGFQEVVIDTPTHLENFSDLSVKQIEAVLKLYQVRSEKLMRDKKIKYILCFKNQGKAAGASLRHIHSQIFASTILPPDIIEERKRVAILKADSNRCPYCDLSKQEENGDLKIYSDSNIVAFCPFASAFPYEVWIITRRHVDNIALLKKSEVNSLAKALKNIASKLKNLDCDFNFFTHNDIDNDNQHFYLKVQPRMNIWAGVELGSGLIINPVLPEKAAKHYCK
ncbi:hypothetical protein CVU83_00320 [Candidatus Falkowbacteria bacterium HGW-Falkowbacteria-2]|uniref:Galactose-1-phosphate uridyl transferase N-terminal domain-containing protein n=1 Tax=Candidatus Falkowbacteria bacterium HGW-Falkowbacteria-2 TaxID=2013769 RepID=A0A2N2E3I4_9BACT|nr:MAG: hypothetical protein CVU83_00320 [Candidatus Falkowbacteria bacterium HGW-Falkowbacteria-2]